MYFSSYTVFPQLLLFKYLKLPDVIQTLSQKSDFHNFLFFSCSDIINFFDEFICKSLNILFNTLEIIFCDFVVFLSCFKGFDSIASYRTNSNLAVFALGFDCLCNFFSAFFRNMRKRRRIALPSFVGVMPISDLRIAFSTSPRILASHG